MSAIATPHDLKRALKNVPKDAVPELLVAIVKRAIDEGTYNQLPVHKVVEQLEKQIRGPGWTAQQAQT